jgi:hypothetical protein
MSIATALHEELKKHKEKHEREHPRREGKGKGKSEGHHRVDVEKAEDGAYTLRAHKKYESGEYHEPTVHVAKSHNEMKQKIGELMCPSAAGEDAEEEK